MKKLDRIAREEVGLDVEGGPAEPHGEFKRPHIARLVDDCIDVYIPDVADAIESGLQRLEDEIREFTAENISQDGAHLARVRPYVAAAKALVLEILFESMRKTGWPKPSANGELDAVDPLLK